MQHRKNNGIIMVVVPAVIFGLLGGIIGELISRAYILENNFNIPLFGEINLSQTGSGESNLVIRGARNVIVEQDIKILDAAQEIKSGIVGIFVKLAVTPPAVPEVQNATGTSGKFDPENYYRRDDALAPGFIITSDGWIVSDFLPPEIKTIPGQSPQAAEKNRKDAAKKYVIITHDRKIYQVDDITPDKLSGYAFWHVDAIDLPVRRFMENNEISGGRLVFAENRDGWIWPATISGLKDRGGKPGTVISSDGHLGEIILEAPPAEEFYGYCLFNLNGDMAGFIGSDGKVSPISNFLPAIRSLLKTKSVSRPALGVNYTDLSGFIYRDGDGAGADKGALIAGNKAGAAVIKGGAADLGGLKDGDIIVSIDNQDLNADNDLRKIINGHIAGDEISVVYLRKGERMEVKIKLQELK